MVIEQLVSMVKVWSKRLGLDFIPLLEICSEAILIILMNLVLHELLPDNLFDPVPDNLVAILCLTFDNLHHLELFSTHIASELLAPVGLGGIIVPIGRQLVIIHLVIPSDVPLW